MNLVKFEYDKDITYCPSCEKDADCPECNSKLEYCYHCGESIERHECFILFTEEKYHGWDNPSSYVAKLFIDGKDYAAAWVEPEESDTGADVIHMQLFYFGEDQQTDVFAEIIASFAKWLRFDWHNSDMQSQSGLPSLVRLLGFTTDKRNGMLWRSEMWIAMQNALEIKKEHLAYEFTSKEIV